MIHKISTFFEYNIKQVGLFSGLFFSFVILPIIFLIDLHFVYKYNILETEYYKALTVFNNSLSSILIAILLTTFSVVFVVMQLASTQFSPRILRYFMANDLKIQQFIGIYLGAIASIFLLQVLSPLFVVKFQLCIISSIILSFYCILINFPNVIIHLNDNMNVATITNKIKTETIQEIDLLYTEQWQKNDCLLYKKPKNTANEHLFPIIWTGKSGYLSEVNYSKLSKQIRKFIAKNPSIPAFKTHQKPIIGEFIMGGNTVVLTVQFNKAIDQDTVKILENHFNKIVLAAFQVHRYRSYRQDISFGVRKLVDIAIKAISPAVNDPTTCLNCIDYLGEIVRQLSLRKFPSTQTQKLQQENIYINEFDFKEFINFAFDQIFYWGKKDLVVVKRLLQTIYQILPCVSNPHNLKILIKEVEDMELEKIYRLQDTEDYTLEQRTAVQKELQKFNVKAKIQIEKIKSAGILSVYDLQPNETNDNLSAERLIEIESLAYLTRYLVS